MEKTFHLTSVVVSTLFLMVCGQATLATPYHATIDVSSLIGSDLELEINLYDNSGTVGDSWGLIDNVSFGGVREDFEAGDIGGFDDSLNPTSVDAALGSLRSLYGVGSYVMRIDEDPSFTPTITWRDFAGSTATTLAFDFEFFGDPGGQDELVFSILAPGSLNPLLPGLTPGFGDVLAVRSDGMDYTSDVTISSIPEPITMLGVFAGFGSVLTYLRQRRLT